MAVHLAHHPVEPERRRYLDPEGREVPAARRRIDLRGVEENPRRETPGIDGGTAELRGSVDAAT